MHITSTMGRALRVVRGQAAVRWNQLVTTLSGAMGAVCRAGRQLVFELEKAFTAAGGPPKMMRMDNGPG